MAYYPDDITGFSIRRLGRGVAVRGRTERPCAQLYLNAALAGTYRPAAQAFEFVLPHLGGSDVVHVLAVDSADARTDFFAEAFGADAAHGNRIRMTAVQDPACRPGDSWRVYLGEKGSASADTLVWEQEVFPAGEQFGGFGATLGFTFGYDWRGRGWGYSFGSGPAGFDVGTLEYRSGPLAPGTYPVKLVLADAAGNESAPIEQEVTVAACARPASDLAVASYTPATDTLVLAWTASEDL